MMVIAFAAGFLLCYLYWNAVVAKHVEEYVRYQAEAQDVDFMDDEIERFIAEQEAEKEKSGDAEFIEAVQEVVRNHNWRRTGATVSGAGSLPKKNPNLRR